MRNLAALLALAFLFACDVPTLLAEWEKAPYTYTCTAEQMSRAQDEAAWCRINTQFSSTYCYGSAILRLCTPKGHP